MYPCSVTQTTRRPMTANDYIVASDTRDEITLLGLMSSYNLDWPNTVLHNNERYQFESQETMPRYAIGNYHGCARYVQVKNPY